MNLVRWIEDNLSWNEIDMDKYILSMEAFSWTVFEGEVSINEVKGDANVNEREKWTTALINILETYMEYCKDALTAVAGWRSKKCKWLNRYNKNTT